MSEQNEIIEKLANLEKLAILSAKKALTIDDVSLLYGLSKSYIYRLVWEHKIPHYKPSSKTLYFEKSELDKWLLQNKVDAIQESQSQAMLRTR